MATDKGASTIRPARAAAPRAATPGAVQKARKYLGEVNTELKKTTWPSRAELRAQTQVVLGMLILLSTLIWVWDTVLSWIFKGILRLLGVQ